MVRALTAPALWAIAVYLVTRSLMPEHNAPLPRQEIEFFKKEHPAEYGCLPYPGKSEVICVKSLLFFKQHRFYFFCVTFRADLTPDRNNRPFGIDKECIPLGTEKFPAKHRLWFP
jgi:hypothetical protein